MTGTFLVSTLETFRVFSFLTIHHRKIDYNCWMMMQGGSQENSRRSPSSAPGPSFRVALQQLAASLTACPHVWRGSAAAQLVRVCCTAAHPIRRSDLGPEGEAKAPTFPRVPAHPAPILRLWPGAVVLT